MSKQKDSDDLVRVGPGTAMGEMMRQYWIPAVMSSELERDGAPMRLMLLGERLILGVPEPFYQIDIQSCPLRI